MNHKRRQWWIIGFLACILSLLVAGSAFVFFRSGIQVTIQNTGSQPLPSVVLHVTGASYSLGDIAPGATAKATVHSTGESHLEIEFSAPDGQLQRLDAGGYFESGYKGAIQVAIQDGIIQKNRQEIRLHWWLP